MYQIKNPDLLKKILWVDFNMGCSTGIVGIVFVKQLTTWLGLPKDFIVIVSLITLAYSIVAFMLARQKAVSIPLLRLLVNANWLWAIVSVALLLHYHEIAQTLGFAFLILQIIVVAGLAYLEGAQITNIQ